MLTPHLAAAPEPELSLPGWIYRDPEFHEVEMERVIRPSWQVVCHGSEIPAAGNAISAEPPPESKTTSRSSSPAVRASSSARRAPSTLPASGNG